MWRKNRNKIRKTVNTLENTGKEDGSLKRKQMFFLLFLAGCLLLSGCGQKKENQVEGELVLTSSPFLADILNLQGDFVIM